MRLHILGICGTFMSGLALLAKESGHEVSGSDANVYPPMSMQLEEQGIKLLNGYDAKHVDDGIDMVIVGNVVKRGNPEMEYVLNHRIPYLSGPEWLSKYILNQRTVLAVSGTHGKTTTSSLLAWILDQAGFDPGFLIGGIPQNFSISARLGNSPYFVIEADEYDSAFFDKRSKFIHYHPNILILNNLEFDHADIFPDLASIKQQFHYLIRTIPENGLIIREGENENLDEMLKLGCWTKTESFGGKHDPWQAQLVKSDGSQFDVLYHQKKVSEVHWNLLGNHNVKNALAAIAAAHHINISVELSARALATFKNVKRRMEIKAQSHGVVIYDDFAHHPTAIATTLAGLRAKVGKESRVIAILEFGSYTMRKGVHKDKLKEALEEADLVVCKDTESDWGLKQVLTHFTQPTAIYADVESLVSGLAPDLRAGDHVVVMSNAGFDGIHKKLLLALEQHISK